MTDKPTLPAPKNRHSIIDTTIQRQDELRALRWLLGLFLLTVCYEFGGDALLWAFPTDVPIPELGSAQRKTLPPKRIQMLADELELIVRGFPLVRHPMGRFQERLAGIKTLLADPKNAKAAQADLEPFLQEMRAFFLSPLWDDQTPFRQAQVQINSLMTILKTSPREFQSVPHLPIGPRQFSVLSSPQRDPFQFLPGTAPRP